MARILIIDDEEDILQLLSYNLEREGHDILTAADGKRGWALATAEGPDLILLDLMLPGIDGLELCRMLRGDGRTAGIPIMMLTARGEEVDKVVGLEMGADDYVTKPFSLIEMKARVKALLRRTRKPAGAQAFRRFGDLAVNLAAHEVEVSGQRVELSPLEFRLLAFFIDHPDRVYERDHLLNRVWGEGAFVEPRTVDVHIRRLREKIAPEGARLIRTVRGAGYIFSERGEETP